MANQTTYSWKTLDNPILTSRSGTCLELPKSHTFSSSDVLELVYAVALSLALRTKDKEQKLKQRKSSEAYEIKAQ